MNKISTVNVVEYAPSTLIGIHSYSDTPEGNKEAEATFKAIARENGAEITDEEMEVFLGDGYYEQGDYQLFLTHSS